MESRKPLSIVEENLRKPAVSNPDKSIAEVIIDGSYKPQDLTAIMFSSSFPDNKFDDKNPYSTGQAMAEFAAEISPYLSNAELFALTNKLIEIEIMQSETQAFRTETLTKPFLKIEIERCSQGTPAGQLPPVLLHHLQKDIFPLMQRNWGGKIDENVARFIDFNLGIKGIIDPLKQINGFKAGSFNANSLSKVAPNVAEIDEFLGQYASAPASRKKTDPKISTPTLSRKETSDNTRVRALTQTLQNLEKELRELDTMNAALKTSMQKSQSEGNTAAAAAIMKKIAELNAPGRIAELNATIKQTKAAINTHAPAAPPKPPKATGAAKGGLFSKRQAGHHDTAVKQAPKKPNPDVTATDHAPKKRGPGHSGGGE